jgi:sRNA-binding carbon storage regulator CsrA
MLVISRCSGERLVIFIDGHRIEMTFKDFGTKRCRIAIDGPSHARYERAERLANTPRTAERPQAKDNP